MDKCSHLDWLVTIMFYSALHLIEKKLEIKGESSHGGPNSHLIRNNKVIRLFPKEIASKYLMLYSSSRKARYDCIPFTPGRVTHLKQCLEIIEENIG